MEQYRNGELVFDVIDRGPADGPVVILLHGFPQTNASWAPVMDRLVAAGYRCACRFLRLSDVPRAIANHDTRGGIKVVADADTGKVLGIHALADTAGEMMLAATYAIKAGFTVTQLADTWAPYLTMAEGIRLTANLFRNELPTSCCA